MWNDFASPSTYASDRQQQEITLIENILETEAGQRDLEAYLQSALHLTKDEVESILWEPPRSLMMAVSLIARPDARGDLKSAILGLAAEPVELGFLQVYPQVEGVQRHPRRFEEVENAIKTLLATKNLEEDIKLREKLFEEVEFIIDISAYTKGIEELLKKEEIEFIPPDSRRFIMNEKIWSVIQNNFLEEYKKIENSKKTNMTTKTKIDEQINQLLNSQAFQLLKDYSILEELFKKNLLFVNIQ